MGNGGAGHNFYDDNGCITGQNPIWMRVNLEKLVGMFDPAGLTRTWVIPSP